LFVGHYSVSFAGGAAERRLPLWLLFIAVQFLDVMWAVFVLLGIEKVRIVPGFTASNPLDLYYMPYTHTLLSAIAWSGFAFLICQLFPRLRGRRTGLIVAVAVFSHWVLDLIVHRPDLALYDSQYKMGFGLWNYRVPAFILEIGLLIGGAALYLGGRSHKGANHWFCLCARSRSTRGNILFSATGFRSGRSRHRIVLIPFVCSRGMVGRMTFTIEAQSGPARAGRIFTPHGEVETPVFMPVGTQASVKSVPQDVLEELGAQIVLGNTYHLYLRPGHETIRILGGLHKFMSWERALLTDSGGFQVFSLSDLRKVSEEGVQFRSHLDGSSHLLTPERSIEIQIALGADIIMAFDECTEHPADAARTRQSMELTLRWARRCRDYFAVHKREVPWSSQGEQALFGIVQGGMYADLRRESAERTVELDFPGYAIGGLSVGESREKTMDLIAHTLEFLPKDRPRYVMGVGYPEEIAQYARMGVEMMDCVLPTRAARHGLIFTSEGRLNIKNTRFASDSNPLDANCRCKVCSRYTRAYLRHLFLAGEPVAGTLNTVHNLAYYLDTMRTVRHAIHLGVGSGTLSGSVSSMHSERP
jgi:queuine tRNA-ribosyltransferase